MKAQTKKGKVIHGRIAEIFVKKGIASEIIEEEIKKEVKKAPVKRKTKK